MRAVGPPPLPRLPPLQPGQSIGRPPARSLRQSDQLWRRLLLGAAHGTRHVDGGIRFPRGEKGVGDPICGARAPSAADPVRVVVELLGSIADEPHRGEGVRGKGGRGGEGGGEGVGEGEG